MWRIKYIFYLIIYYNKQQFSKKIIFAFKTLKVYNCQKLTFGIQTLHIQ